MNNTAVAVKPKKTNLIAKFAARFSVDETKVMGILKATAFKQRDGKPPTDEQMMALLIVADQYGLNPFVKEIYAYPDKSNGIVPVVSVDGWSRIMNEHPQMDGIEFRYSEETTMHKGKKCHVWIESIITRKDRSKPVVIREYFDEVVRSVNYPTPWDSHPNRMHRHKTLIQGSRTAFGFAGIYDEDEAARIIDITDQVDVVEPDRPQLVQLEDGAFLALEKKFRTYIENGQKSADDMIAWVEGKGTTMSDAQKQAVRSWAEKPVTVEAEEVDEEFVAAMDAAEGVEA